MALRDHPPRAQDQDVHRGRRFGHLTNAPEREGVPVRCACDRCGAHLHAITVGGGSLAGNCPVCLSQQFSPV